MSMARNEWTKIHLESDTQALLPLYLSLSLFPKIHRCLTITERARLRGPKSGYGGGREGGCSNRGLGERGTGGAIVHVKL